MAQRKRQYNPASDMLATKLNLPIDVILRVSRKAETKLRSLSATRFHGTVRNNDPAVHELVDHGLVFLRPTVDYEYSFATIIKIDEFKVVEEFKDQPDVVVHGPNSFKIRYGFDAMTSWREFVLQDYARYMKTLTK